MPVMGGWLCPSTSSEVGFPHFEIRGSTIEKLTVSGDILRHGHFGDRTDRASSKKEKRK